MHSSRMNTTHFSGSGGGSLSPFTETPFTEIPLPRDPSPDRDPQERTWDQAARQEVTSYRDPSEQTDTCENSTLPQTSLAGGNNFTIRNTLKSARNISTIKLSLRKLSSDFSVLLAERNLFCLPQVLLKWLLSF